MLQILLLLYLLLHFRMKIYATSITYNAVFPIISIVKHNYWIVCRIPITWHTSSTAHKKNIILTVKRSFQWLMKVCASRCWRILQTNSKTQNGRAIWCKHFQITYYVQYQFHKVFRSVLTKAGRGSRDTAHPCTSFPAIWHVKNAPPRNIILVITF